MHNMVWTRAQSSAGVCCQQSGPFFILQAKLRFGKKFRGHVGDIFSLCFSITEFFNCLLCLHSCQFLITYHSPPTVLSSSVWKHISKEYFSLILRTTRTTCELRNLNHILATWKKATLADIIFNVTFSLC